MIHDSEPQSKQIIQNRSQVLNENFNLSNKKIIGDKNNKKLNENLKKICKKNNQNIENKCFNIESERCHHNNINKIKNYQIIDACNKQNIDLKNNIVKINDNDLLRKNSENIKNTNNSNLNNIYNNLNNKNSFNISFKEKGERKLSEFNKIVFPKKTSGSFNFNSNDNINKINLSKNRNNSEKHYEILNIIKDNEMNKKASIVQENYYNVENNNDYLKTTNKINSSKLLNSINQDSTTIISSSKRITNADSQSQNFSGAQYSISNNKSNINYNSFNNVSISDFASKISFDNPQIQNNTLYNVNLINNNNISNEAQNIFHKSNSNFIVSDNAGNFDKTMLNLPKGFQRNTVNYMNKKILPIKLKNFNELKKLERHSIKESSYLENTLYNKQNLEKKRTFYENEKSLIEETKIENFENSKIEFFENEKKTDAINITKEDTKHHEKTLIDFNSTQKLTALHSEEDEASKKEQYLEKLYNKISNKNFNNLKKDLDEYIDLFSNNNLKNELQSLKQRLVILNLLIIKKAK